MEKNKFSLERKILIAEAVLVAGILMYLFVLNSPQASSPVSGQAILEPDYIFEISDGESLLISSTQDFTNPIVLEKGGEIDLPPGEYYWKVKSLFGESDAKSFTIKGIVGLSVKKQDDKNILENSGNVDLDVTKKKDGITTNIPLDSGKSTEIENSGTYEGGQR